MAFPESIDSFATKVNNVDVIDASHVNTLQSTIVTMQEALINRQHNFLYHSLTHDLWQEGTTFNDIADDTYVADLWNVIHSGNAPDITGEAGGSDDPFARYFRCTFDSTAQCGILQFLENADAIRLRGKSVTLSFDAWGTGVTTLRAAVLNWSGTADSITSDVVSSWATGDPTLAANWTYVNTASDITISGTRDRKSVESVTVPTTSSNLAVFIWTPNSEVNTDLFNVANVKLEPNEIETPFVARLFEDERRLVSRFMQTLDVSGGTTEVGFGRRLSGTQLVVTAPYQSPPMIASPHTFSHNISAYQASGSPTGTELSAVNLTANGVYTLTGSLTVASSALAKSAARLLLTAGTSWSGANGDISALRFGSGVIAVLDARL